MLDTAFLTLLGVGAVLLLLTLYDLAIALVALRPPRPAPPATRRRRFAVFVAAHDEERVIGLAVETLRGQGYPAELFEVFVVADRCQDGTAAAARRAGAVVHERPAGVGPAGKPAALRWLLERVAETRPQFDALCVFDADNLAAPNYLETMNRHLEAGETCIQAYLDTKNPGDSWISGSIAIAYWTTNRLWQSARHRLGLCCALGGTGFCLEWDTAVRLAWRKDCLTEDLDLQVQLVLEGKRVSWAHETRIYDEKPLRLRASARQRLRWMRGHWDVASRTFLRLLRRAALRRDVRALDTALYTLQPLRTVVGAAGLLGFLLIASTGERPAPQVGLLGVLMLPHLAYLAHFCFAGIPILGLVLERVPLRYWRYYPAAFVFGLTWVPIAAWGILTSRRTAWSHTVHARDVSLAERLALERVPPLVVSFADAPGDALGASGEERT